MIVPSPKVHSKNRKYTIANEIMANMVLLLRNQAFAYDDKYSLVSNKQTCLFIKIDFVSTMFAFL